jgi:long-subunit fatty acid transport protein
MLNSSEIELVISYTIAHQCQVGVGLIMGELNLGFENHDGLCNSMNLDSNQ